MKRLISIFIAVAITLSGAVLPVYAAETVDYSAYLTELKELMDECEAKGIPTDYELVSYSTIERFQEYINQDLANGIETTCTNYEKECIETLYTETKASLEAYLDGSKEAFVVKRPDMNNLSIDGKYVYDGEDPVFSIGYGYFNRAKNDIPNFQDFGVNNIQFEIGPTDTRGQETDIWYRNNDATENEKVKSNRATSPTVTGEHSLYMQHSDTSQDWKALGVAQDFTLEAGTYTLSLWVAGQYDTTKNCIVFEGDAWAAYYLQDFEVASAKKNDFQKYTKTITVPEGKTNSGIKIVTNGNSAGFYIDDISIVNNATGEEMIKNGSFETENTQIPAIEDMKTHLKNAEEHNIAVSLLLSPHYFPEGIDGVDYVDEVGFLNYNIDDENAKTIVEEHIRTVLSEVKDYDAIESICISNEPLFDTRWYTDHFRPKFVDYLYEKYGSFDAIKAAHGKSYSSNDSIKMPTTTDWGILGTSYTTDALAYDWMEFNDKVFADWHKWMADIVGEYMPNTPVHTKMIENLTHGEGVGREEISRGTNFEMFGEFLDIAGCDDLEYSTDGYYETIFLYDYLQSSVGKPVYNSETHIIKDYGWDDDPEAYEFSTDTTKVALNQMWQEAVHGRSLSTVWLWDRDDSATHTTIYGSVLYRPDLVDGIGKTNLDLMRLSDELVELQTYSDKVAIFYSLPSRLYEKSYTENLFTIYEELLENGYDVGVVTEKSVDTLSEYDTLIIPKGATHTTAEALTAIKSFASKGGKVLCGATTVLKYDELDNSITPNISGVATYSVSALPEKSVVLKDTSGNVVSGIDWQYSVTEDRILVNASATAAKSFDVYYNGTKLANMTELISGTNGIGTVSLNSYEPMLLEYKLTSDTVSKEADIQNLTFDDIHNKLYWESVGEDYAGANVYKYNTNGTVQLLGNTAYDTYAYPETGTYIVRPVLNDGTMLEGKVITTVAPEDSVEISKVKEWVGHYNVTVENNTGNYLRCKVVVEMYDIDGNVIKYGYGKSFIAPNMSNEVELLMKRPADYDHAVIYVYDDLNNILAIY